VEPGCKKSNPNEFDFSGFAGLRSKKVEQFSYRVEADFQFHWGKRGINGYLRYLSVLNVKFVDHGQTDIEQNNRFPQIFVAGLF